MPQRHFWIKCFLDGVCWQLLAWATKQQLYLFWVVKPHHSATTSWRIFSITSLCYGLFWVHGVWRHFTIKVDCSRNHTTPEVLFYNTKLSSPCVATSVVIVTLARIVPCQQCSANSHLLLIIDKLSLLSPGCSVRRGSAPCASRRSLALRWSWRSRTLCTMSSASSVNSVVRGQSVGAHLADTYTRACTPF